MSKHQTLQCVETVLDEAPSEEIENPSNNFLDDVVRHTEKTARVNGVVVGTLARRGEDGIPYVDFSMNPTGRPLPARSTVEIKDDHAGRDVALMFEQNDVRKPIIIGLMHVPSIQVAIDGEVKEITAEKELLLRCGKASILLRRDGKIIIKGENILSRARMNNKVKGGSIQLN